MSQTTRIARLVGESAKFACDLDDAGKIVARFHPIDGRLYITDCSQGSEIRRISLDWLAANRLLELLELAMEPLG